MVRLSAEVLARAEERINFLGDRELNLRSHGIPMIENLGAVNDQFQCVDFTNNEITQLGGFPLMRRVRVLQLTNNRIDTISPHFPKSVPFLTTLNLANNSIKTLAELEHLRGLKMLDTLVLVGNPVVLTPGYRQFCITLLPSLQTLDYSRIKLKERKVGAKAGEEERKISENTGEQEDKRRLMVLAIQNATTREEVERLESLLSLGIIPDDIANKKRVKTSED